MKIAAARLTPELLAVVEAMRGGQPRSHFLTGVIRRGVIAMHAEATKNTPIPVPGGLGLAPLKVEGEYHYFDPDSVERIGKLIDRLL